jgi:hypothetical protein
MNEEEKNKIKGWEPMMLFIASILVIIMVLIELVNAVILTIFGVRTLKASKYVLMHETVIVNVPSKKKILANIEDLPKL